MRSSAKIRCPILLDIFVDGLARRAATEARQ